MGAVLPGFEERGGVAGGMVMVSGAVVGSVVVPTSPAGVASSTAPLEQQLPIRIYNGGGAGKGRLEGVSWLEG